MAEQSRYRNFIDVVPDGFGLGDYGGVDGLPYPKHRNFRRGAVISGSAAGYRLDYGLCHGSWGQASGTVDACHGFPFAGAGFVVAASAHANGSGWFGMGRGLALCPVHARPYIDVAGFGGLVVPLSLEGLSLARGGSSPI